MGEQRVGLGFDVHARSVARALRLGGVDFAGEQGLSGHSDGDVVCHAVGDALLGAAALGDIGDHFPDSDPALAGISGAELLAGVVALLAGSGRRPRSVDVTAICDRPPIAPRRREMRAALAAAIGLDETAVSVKATRPEGLGLTGEGIGAIAVATVE